jgi:general stress protein 26
MSENRSHASQRDAAKLGQFIWDIRIALLTTVDQDGRFHSRPVETLQVEGTVALWFFTDWSSAKVEELRRDIRVSLGYADPSKHVYVAVSGVGTLLHDTDKAREIWTIEQRAYYPEGPEDPRLALLRVRIEHAEYWVAPGPLSYLGAAAKAALTGTPVRVIGENSKIK